MDKTVDRVNDNKKNKGMIRCLLNTRHVETRRGAFLRKIILIKVNKIRHKTKTLNKTILFNSKTLAVFKSKAK